MGTAQSPRQVLITFLFIFVWIPFAPLVVLFLTVQEYRRAMEKRAQAGRPPRFSPGSRPSDYKSQLFVYPIQRFRMKPEQLAQNKTGMMDSVLPYELCELVIDFCQEDQASLRACGLVCAAWAPRAHRHLFRSIHVSKGRAYSFIKLIRSPYCSPSIIPSIKKVRLDGDDQHWHTVHPIMKYLVRFGIKPDTLSVNLYQFPGTIHKKRWAQLGVTHLHLICDRWKMTNVDAFIRFITAFQSLETLWVDFRGNMPAPDDEMTFPEQRRQRMVLCPSLKRLTLRFPTHSATHVGRGEIIQWFTSQKTDNLKFLTLLCPDAVTVPREIDWLRSYTQSYTGITRFGFGVWLMAETVARGLGSGFASLLKDNREILFPNLRAVHIECLSTYSQPSHRLRKLIPQITQFIHKLKLRRISSTGTSGRSHWGSLSEITIGVREAGLIDATPESMVMSFMFLPSTPFKLVTGPDQNYNKSLRFKRESSSSSSEVSRGTRGSLTLG